MDKAAAARLDGVAVEAGRSFILDWHETIARANTHHLFITTLQSNCFDPCEADSQDTLNKD